MTLEIEVDGRVRQVTVEAVDGSSDQYLVTFDGKTRQFDARTAGADVLSLICRETRASYEVRFTPGKTTGELGVTVGDLPVAVAINARRGRRGAGAGSGGGEQRLVAPMPGKVLRVLIQAGDEISARQPLVVVEAMKMENELSVTRAGRVKEVAVSAGQSVEAGRLLMIVE